MATRDDKIKLIERTRQKVAKYFDQQSDRFSNDVARLISKGVFTVKDLQKQLRALGYTEAVIKGLAQFSIILDMTKEQFEATGYKFLFTEQNEIAFHAMMRVKTTVIGKGGLSKFADDLIDYSIQAKLSKKPTKQIIDEMRERFSAEGRRIGTEVDTALSLFDRTTESMLYDNVGIDKYIYWGPIDAENRETCLRALNSPFQETGWTLADINSFPGIDRFQGGFPYYNCRHRFIPYDPEMDQRLEKRIEEIHGD